MKKETQDKLNTIKDLTHQLDDCERYLKDFKRIKEEGYEDLSGYSAKITEES